MITANDITSRCPVSERPFYVVFRRGSDHETGAPFWSGGSLANDQSEALFKANEPPVYPDAAYDCFVLATTFDEAVALNRLGQRFTDAEVAIYRSPYPAMAAE
ncbi:hypothetical protein [Ruegeria sp. EL01]|uniref:hypothetical protein n=1 Tax=Ruegeria sp. EL01 TaxID=2107578 RepID=UPI000EA8280D|nr:hypothetical protein [Ruegeria sp. EL01]